MLQKKPQQLLTVLALSACAVEPETLNSERILAHFGSYGIQIVSQQSNTRRSNLYSEDASGRTCRTYAIVDFDVDGIESAKSVHTAILDGGSIGQSFIASGWQVEKQTTYIGVLKRIPADNEVVRLMRLHQDADLAVHVYRLWIRKNAERVHYARIIEAHHPDYLREPDLDKRFAVDDDARIGLHEVATIRTRVLDSN